MQTPGAAVHSESDPHARQVLVARLQIGVLPEQVALSVHCTQAPLAAQAGCSGSAAAHSTAVAQPVHERPIDEQMGVAPEQLAWVRHCAHRPVLVSHRGLAPAQVELSMHSTHWPVIEQAARRGSACWHSAAVPQAAQMCFAVLQIGVTPAQLALVRHSTQVLVAMLHTGAGSEQVELSMHSTQAPVPEHAR